MINAQRIESSIVNELINAMMDKAVQMNLAYGVMVVQIDATNDNQQTTSPLIAVHIIRGIDRVANDPMRLNRPANFYTEAFGMISHMRRVKQFTGLGVNEAREGECERAGGVCMELENGWAYFACSGPILQYNALVSFAGQDRLLDLAAVSK